MATNSQLRSEVVVDYFRRLQKTGYGTSICLLGFHLLSLLGFRFFTEQSAVIFNAKLLQLNEEITQMRFERRQIHVDIKHSVHKFSDLAPCEIGEARNEQIRNVLTKECRVGLPGSSGGWIKERDRDLIHLYKMEHVTKESCMHFEAGFVETVGHNSKDILNECKQILLVESLSDVGSFPDIQEKLVKNIETLERDR